MQPLYKTATKYTLNEHIKYMTTVNRESSTYNGISFILMAIIMAVGVLIYIKTGELSVALMCAGIGVAFPFLLELRLRHEAKSTFEKNKDLQDLAMEIDFYYDHFEQKSEKGLISIKYSQLYKIIENKTNVYLMISPYAGTIVLKDNCSPELLEFLEEKKAELKKK